MGQEKSRPEMEIDPQRIQELCILFMKECPSGDLHLHEFKRIFGLHHNATEEESAYMENVFRSFDTNGDGYIDFMEYIAAVHLILRGKLRDKLAWSFKVFDRDGNGCLDREEVRLVIKIIHEIKKPNDPDAGADVEQIVERIFSLVAKNNDSQISLDEFIEGAEKDPWVMEQLHLDIGPCEWFMEHQENKH
uniref:EF-hand domain-containing protein n=1 Tax=Neogobius melanostomus TaxID=47308 RepID=A0A8C6THF1_9GOBI